MVFARLGVYVCILERVQMYSVNFVDFFFQRVWAFGFCWVYDHPSHLAVSHV